MCNEWWLDMGVSTRKLGVFVRNDTIYASFRLALQVVQRNLRKYLQLRTWPWWKLWQRVKPLLNVTRIEDEIAVRVPRLTCVLEHFDLLNSPALTVIQAYANRPTAPTWRLRDTVYLARPFLDFSPLQRYALFPNIMRSVRGRKHARWKSPAPLSRGVVGGARTHPALSRTIRL